MKKKLAALFLGITLSFTIGAQVGAEVLDQGFSSEFTSEADGGFQDGFVSESGNESGAEDTETGTDGENAGSSIGIGVETPTVSDSDEGVLDGTLDEDDPQMFLGQEAMLAAEVPSDVVPETEAMSDTVFEVTEWEKTEDGRFRLRKKVSADADVVEEVLYYTAADGIAEITTRNGKNVLHKNRYLFDNDGYLLTGTASSDGEYYFTPAEEAAAYNEYKNEDTELTPWTSNLGSMKTNSWVWLKNLGAFHYYGENGKSVSVKQLDAQAKADNIYTGYFKINGEYYALNSKGVPRTGLVTLSANGESNVYYFMPASSAGEIPGKMFHDGWLKLKGASTEKWKYCDPGKKDSSKIGQILVHGNMLTNFDGKKNGKTVYLIDKTGYIIKNGMKKADDGKYYLTDKYGRPYKNKVVTYKNKLYYVDKTGARVTWKNGWYTCKDLNNSLYYFDSTPGRIILKTGWQKVVKNGKVCGWFYFDKDGSRCTNQWIGDRYVRESGKMASGLWNINGRYYYFTPTTGTAQNGNVVKNQLITHKNRIYYASASGAIRKNGWQNVNGKWYYFKNMKNITKKFVKKSGKYVYIDAPGSYLSGWQVVNNSQNLVRYINPDAPGYVKDTSKWIGGKLYYFDKNGYRINDLTNIYKGPYTLEVDRVNGVMTVYADSARTIPVKSIRVSVGNPGTPTPTGSYRLTRYSRWQPLMGPSWGQYGTHVDGAGQGGIFIHSIACNQPNSYNLAVGAYYKLGSPASHGCIRTCVGDAKWVYENCNGSWIRIFDGSYKSDEVFKGPLGRRAITPLQGTKYGGYYDPTDPYA